MVEPVFSEKLQKLRANVEREMEYHSPKPDARYHNYGTALALAATGAATILPETLSIWARISAGIGTFVIALSRALDFGGRWRWHLEMRSQYMALRDRIDQIDTLPEEERIEAVKRIYDQLVALRVQEKSIPGTGAPSPSGTA